MFQPTKTTILFLLAIGACQVFARESNSAKCTSEGLCQITRFVKADDGNLVPMSYSFKFRRPKNGAPTIVKIPGGPGGTSFEESVDSLGAPADFGVMLTDPRFVGINEVAHPEKFKNAMTSDAVAEDILEALKSVGVKSYILYGQSYGTVVATIAASKASATPPRAIVLDGTLGRALTQKEHVADFEREWATYWSKLSESSREKFKQRIREIKAQGRFSDEDMFTIFQLSLMVRNLGPQDYIGTFVNSVMNDPIGDVTKSLQDSLDRMNDDSEAAKLFHAIVACREIYLDNEAEADFSFAGIKGKTSTTDLGPCTEFAESSQIKRFDAEDYQVNSPIFYLQGENDPATPSWQAIHHYKGQKQSVAKRMIVVPGGGHVVLTNEIAPCREDFWQTLLSDIGLANQTLTACAMRLRTPRSKLTQSHSNSDTSGTR